jgi:PPOX class probable F420-dependent enzyme
MTARLDDRARELLDGRPLTTLTTINASGQPQSTIVFVRRDGDTVLFSTIKGRVKTRNMVRDPRVTLLVLNTADRRWVEIQGTVQIDEDPQKVLLHEMYGRFMDGAEPPPEPTAERLVVRVTPTRVFTFPPAAPVAATG